MKSDGLVYKDEWFEREIERINAKYSNKEKKIQNNQPEGSNAQPQNNDPYLYPINDNVHNKELKSFQEHFGVSYEQDKSYDEEESSNQDKSYDEEESSDSDSFQEPLGVSYEQDKSYDEEESSDSDSVVSSYKEGEELVKNAKQKESNQGDSLQHCNPNDIDYSTSTPFNSDAVYVDKHGNTGRIKPTQQANLYPEFYIPRDYDSTNSGSTILYGLEKFLLEERVKGLINHQNQKNTGYDLKTEKPKIKDEKNENLKNKSFFSIFQSFKKNLEKHSLDEGNPDFSLPENKNNNPTFQNDFLNYEDYVEDLKDHQKEDMFQISNNNHEDLSFFDRKDLKQEVVKEKQENRQQEFKQRILGAYEFKNTQEVRQFLQDPNNYTEENFSQFSLNNENFKPKSRKETEDLLNGRSLTGEDSSSDSDSSDY